MKRIQLAFCFCFALTAACAQKKNAFQLGIGYCLPIFKQRLLVNQEMSGPTTIVSQTYASASLGQGFQVDAGYTRTLSPLLALQFNASYFFGANIHLYGGDDDQITGDYSHLSSYARFVQVAPMMRIQFSAKKLRLYSALGPALGLGSIHQKRNMHYTMSPQG